MNITASVLHKSRVAAFGLAIAVISFFTLFNNYHMPDKLFWDENYHIASAEKYLQQRMFMECHPPLGKLLIAAGETLFNPNQSIDKSALVETDHIKEIPNGLSFIGYRFFPVLFAALAALVLYAMLYIISKNSFLAFAGTLLYLFDNAIIVHFRAAMLDGIQLFFIFAFLLVFIIAVDRPQKINWIHYILMALFSGLAVAVKLNGAILMPLFIFLFFWEHSEDTKKLWNIFLERKIPQAFKQLGSLFCKAGIRIAQSVPVFFAVILLVFAIHVQLGKTTLQYSVYKASETYLKIIEEEKTDSLLALPVMIKDNFVYIATYHEGVPKLDFTKPGENGSYPLGWPFGNKAINYRWERTDDGVRYLYLQGNPLVWAFSLCGVLLAAALVVSRFVFKASIQDKRLFNLALVFLFLYSFYMFSMLSIDRVMYLYHYLVPLQFGLILVFILFNYLFKPSTKKQKIVSYTAISILLVSIFSVFMYFSPLSYYQPLQDDAMDARSWSPWWRLEHVE